MPTRLISQLVWLTLGLFAYACGGDDESAPSGGPNLGLDGSVPGFDAGAPTALSEAGAQVGACRGQNGCFSCKPASNRELLNACAEGCQPFDNVRRLPGYQPGKLPPLQ